MIRATAARAFAQLSIDDPNGVLLQQFETEHQLVVRTALIEALGALGGAERLAVIDAAANLIRPPEERQAALEALVAQQCHQGATSQTVNISQMMRWLAETVHQAWCSNLAMTRDRPAVGACLAGGDRWRRTTNSSAGRIIDVAFQAFIQAEGSCRLRSREWRLVTSRSRLVHTAA